MSTRRQFTAVSRLLHWAMAAMVLTMLCVGVAMVASLADYHMLVSIHRPLGIAILILVVVRFVNRLFNPPPPYPATMSRTERLAATASELTMYGLMFALPLVGWGMLSAARYPIVLFGSLHLPNILPHDVMLYAVLRKAHTILAYLFFLTFLAHFGAILFHALIVRDGIFQRMAPWNVRPRLANSSSTLLAPPSRRIIMTELKGFRVAVLATNGVEESELTEPLKALRDAGALVTIVSLAPGRIQGVQHDLEKTVKFEVGRTIRDVSAEEFDAVHLPGGTVNADSMRMVPQVQAFLREMQDAGKPVAAICHAPWELVSAGLVRGRTLTSYHTLQDDIRNAGGNWVDREVVVDGNWVTSRQPGDLAAFNREMLELFSRSLTPSRA